MPNLIDLSDDEGSESDSDPDTDPDDDVTDIYEPYMPNLITLSDDENSDSDTDPDDDATDTMSIRSDTEDPHIPLLSLDEDSDDDDEPDDYFPLEDSITSNTRTEVRLTLQPLQQSQDPTLASFMLTTIELLYDDTLLATGTCMLDTGALQASFIRQDVLDRSPQLRALQRPCTIDVLLGDDADATAVSVSRYVPLTICIPDAKGGLHEAHSVWLLVMPTLSVDVIIGLPHLIRNFPQCFASHLMSAIMSTHANAAVIPDVATMLSNLHTVHRSQRQSISGPLDRPQPSLAIAGDRKVAVLSINVNGFNAACTEGLLNYMAQQYDSHDVLLLQEVKLAPAKQAAARDSLLRIGYTNVAINSIAGSNGVLIAVRSTLVNPIFTCDIPGCDLPDAHGRIMTMTTSDPPVTVVCAYLPFCNPLTDDIAPRCSAFRTHFTQL